MTSVKKRKENEHPSLYDLVAPLITFDIKIKYVDETSKGESD
jgi:hypothetical protein